MVIVLSSPEMWQDEQLETSAGYGREAASVWFL